MSDQKYHVRLRTPMTIEGRRWPAGTIMDVPSDRLRVAAFWCRVNAGRPADERTKHAVELYEAARARPVRGGAAAS